MNPASQFRSRSSATLDQAIRDPDEDLLGVGIYATRLANYILTAEPNLTIGVYGEWGAGKTSFVQLVQQELGNRVRFIPFIAWPYKTSDELWRALILTIARDLYGVAPGSILVESLEADPASFAERCRSFLHKNAIVLHDVSPPAESLDTFKKLVDELDQIQLGSIRKSLGTNLDENQALQATVKTVAAAVSAVSPLGAAIRGFLGLGDDLKLSELLQGDKSKATLSRMQSIERFRELLKDLFEERAGGTRVCVFVDDMDRSMPDVALDLLEAIRIFLGKVNCTFIVAADQELIGQGLKARFHDLMESAQSEQDREFYARKGREYFEKIIQFGVPVPEPTPEEGYRFVSASFPGWAAAADLITAAIGTNPRRLRQYCGLLDYRYGVWEILPRRGRSLPQDSGVPLRPSLPSNISLSGELRDKITSLHWRDPELASGLLRIVQRADFSEKLRALEALLADSKPDVRHPNAEQRLADPDLLDLYLRAVSLTPVMNLLAQQPLLSQQESLVLQTVLGLRDLQPDKAEVLRSQDPAFTRILDKLMQGIPIRPETLLYEDLTRLLELDRDTPDVVSDLIELAKGGDYAEQVKSVELALRDPTRERPSNLSDASRALLEFATDAEVELNELDRRRNLILKKPWLFTVQPGLIHKFATVRDKLPDPHSLLSPEVYGDNPSNADQVSALANHLLKTLKDRQELDDALLLRADLATRYLERRRFAKVDALLHSWPEVGVYLNYDRTRLLGIEDHAVDGKPLEGPLVRFSNDERLVRFLKLRPYFRELYAGEVKKIVATAASASAGTPATVSAPIAPVTQTPMEPVTELLEPKPSEPKPSEPKPSEPKPSEPKPPQAQIPPSVPGIQPYDNWYLRLEPSPAGLTGFYQARLSSADVQEEWKPQIDFSIFIELRKNLMDRAPLKNTMRKYGAHLFEEAFPISIRRLLLERIARNGNPLRLLVELSRDGPLSALPWEALYAPDLAAFPVLDGRLSVVRYAPQPEKSQLLTITPELGGPLKVLAVLPSPVDAAVSNMVEAQQILTSVLQPAMEAGLVHLIVLSGKNASLQEIRQAVRQFRPQLFHYFGHGFVDHREGTGGLVLAGEDGTSRKLAASLVHKLLEGSGVTLAVLLGNETGSGVEIGVQNSVAGLLVTTGTPAAVGTLSPVIQESALLFSRAFYLALIQGENVESALTEARRALNLQDLDWSAYALFNSANRLENLRLAIPQVA
jgi:hypothetical protein